MAQSIGAANLAAGLQDAYLACSPVIALTGRQVQINQYRHAYQEIDHVGAFISIVPMVVALLLFQRYIVRGIALTGMGGT